MVMRIGAGRQQDKDLLNFQKIGSENFLRDFAAGRAAGGQSVMDFRPSSSPSVSPELRAQMMEAGGFEELETTPSAAGEQIQRTAGRQNILSTLATMMGLGAFGDVLQGPEAQEVVDVLAPEKPEEEEEEEKPEPKPEPKPAPQQMSDEEFARRIREYEWSQMSSSEKRDTKTHGSYAGRFRRALGR